MNEILLCGVDPELRETLLSRIGEYAERRDLEMSVCFPGGRKGGRTCHVRIGPVLPGPWILKGGADLVLAGDLPSCVRCLDMLKGGGTVILDSGARMSGQRARHDPQEMLRYIRRQVDDVRIRELAGLRIEMLLRNGPLLRAD